MRSADLLAYLFVGGRGGTVVAVCLALLGVVVAGRVHPAFWLQVVGLGLSGLVNLAALVVFVSAAADSTGANTSPDASRLVGALFVFVFSAAMVALVAARLTH